MIIFLLEFLPATKNRLFFLIIANLHTLTIYYIITLRQPR